MCVEKLIVGSSATNCYLFFDKHSGNCAIIDPGEDADYIIRRISDLNLAPSVSVATHGHFDHLLAAFEISLAYSIPLYVSRGDDFLLKRTGKTAKFFTGNKEVAPLNVKYFDDGADRQITGRLNLKVIATPGHTPGSVVFASCSKKVIFVGDLFFADGSTGDWRHGYSNRSDLIKSVEKIKKNFEGYEAFPGHGESFII